MENLYIKYILKMVIDELNFFYKIPFLNKSIQVLVTNNHILGDNEIKNGIIIKLIIYYNNNNSNNKVKEIQINNSRTNYKNLIKNRNNYNRNKDRIYNYL